MKESGIGRENGIEAFEACKWSREHIWYMSHHSLDSQTKSVIVNISSTEETRQNGRLVQHRRFETLRLIDKIVAVRILAV